jgi:hypothetical protein
MDPSDVRIETFRSQHQAAFATLNRAWLLRYNLVEPADESQHDGDFQARRRRFE